MNTQVTQWLIPDGWMPPPGDGAVKGHEAICILNLTDSPAELSLTFYFEDKEPETVRGLACGARRTRHFRLDFAHEIGDYVLPPETPYALVVESDQPVTVQHTRVDTRGDLALMTTLAMPLDAESAH